MAMPRTAPSSGMTGRKIGSVVRREFSTGGEVMRVADC